MAELSIDLDEEIEVLHKRYRELRKLRIDPPGPSADDKAEQRVQIAFLLAEINNRIAILELVSAHRSAARVLVSCPTREDIDTMKAALRKLHTVISREQSFQQTLDTVTGILAAADTVNAAVKSARV